MRCPVAPPFGGCSHVLRGSDSDAGGVSISGDGSVPVSDRRGAAVLRRWAAERGFIPRGWIDVPYGEEVLPMLPGALQQVYEIDQRLRMHRRLIQAEA